MTPIAKLHTRLQSARELSRQRREPPAGSSLMIERHSGGDT